MTDETTSAPVPPASPADLGAIIKNAASAAAQAAVNGNSSSGTIAAFQTLDAALDGLAEHFAAAVGGPIAGDAATEIVPPIVATASNDMARAIPVMVESLWALFARLGASAPIPLAMLKNDLEIEGTSAKPT